MTRMSRLLFAFLAAGLLILAGCDDLGQFDRSGDYYGNPGRNVVGEVQRVDTRDGQIEIRADSGRNLRLRYDTNTRVVYRQRDYNVADLELGDYVAVRTREDGDGRFYADYVTVRESAQDRGRYSGGGGGATRLERVEGRVEWIDSRRGAFEIRDRGRTVRVTLPYNPRRAVSDRFDRLREGDFVRAEGHYVNDGRFEVENFL